MKFFIGLFAVIIAVIVLWKVNYPSGTWRYKITVEIDTPEGIKTGSAVREMRVSRGLQLNPDVGGVDFGLIGEGVVIDLGQRGVLFSIISPDTWVNEVFKTFHFNGAEASKSGIQYYASLPPGTKGELPSMYYPAFVMIKDMQDRKSVTLVREEAFFPMQEKRSLTDNFEQLFGTGVKLKGIAIEITSEPVTWGEVDKYLPNNFYENKQDGWSQLSNAERHRILHLTTFKKGKPQ